MQFMSSAVLEQGLDKIKDEGKVELEKWGKMLREVNGQKRNEWNKIKLEKKKICKKEMLSKEAK